MAAPFTVTAGSSDYLWLLDNLAIKQPEINWALLIQDMRDQGMSLSKQAFAIGSQFSTLQRWWNGSEPQFKHGHTLIILHSKVCGITLTHERLRQFCG